MAAALTAMLLQTGLLQFGRFQDKAGGRPFLLSLDYLPAYPDVLRAAAQETAARLNGLAVHRLLATAEAVPFGVAAALETGHSLVYSRGSGADAVYDLAGAYNIGHAAVLLVNTLDNAAGLQAFLSSARQVGLEVHTLLAIVDLGTSAPVPGLQTTALLKLGDATRELAAAGGLPAGQAQAVLDWIETRQTRLTPRPGVTSP